MCRRVVSVVSDDGVVSTRNLISLLYIPICIHAMDLYIYYSHTNHSTRTPPSSPRESPLFCGVVSPA